jgi:hypothetical protein
MHVQAYHSIQISTFLRRRPVRAMSAFRPITDIGQPIQISIWLSLEALSVAQVALLALSGAALAADVIAMPGEFAIQTVHPGIYNGFYLTAVDGGGRTENAIHTDARWIRSWELFRLSFDPSTGHYGIQTATNNFVTAVSGGGRTTDVIHTDATQLQSWEKFRLRTLHPR